jgi:hypothetical protein
MNANRFARGVTVWLFSLACSGGSPPWPVPVPPEQGFDRAPGRAEAALPLCGGAATCPEEEALTRLLAEQAKRCTPIDGSTSVPAGVTALVKALKHGELGTAEFPKNALTLPADFRARQRHPALDSRSAFREGSAAVLYHGMWWTFWDRAVLSEVPRKGGGYTYLIVFPEFEGRPGCGESS